ncbi:hypothetical protein SSUR61_0430 [Streptococcus suis R61]|uniref:Uncharacterized protein n=1 Tax=Streptococcus suis R61 TaxID=996306 RepID=A0AA87F9N8_STRSU|nr:hypothetical protein SSUR61_0430 [Streptococcus suis R61]
MVLPDGLPTITNKTATINFLVAFFLIIFYHLNTLFVNYLYKYFYIFLILFLNK